MDLLHDASQRVDLVRHALLLFESRVLRVVEGIESLEYCVLLCLDLFQRAVDNFEKAFCRSSILPNVVLWKWNRSPKKLLRRRCSEHRVWMLMPAVTESSVFVHVRTPGKEVPEAARL